VYQSGVDSLYVHSMFVVSRSAMQVLMEIQHLFKNLEIWSRIIWFSAVADRSVISSLIVLEEH